MPLNRIKLYRFAFGFRAQDPLQFSAFPGSALRGGFGHALLKAVCLADPAAPSCSPCAFAPSCAYAAVFESPNTGDAEIMKKATHRPHPFAMAPLFRHPVLFAEGDIFEMELSLFGRGLSYLPHFIHAFERLGRMGLGRGRAKFFIQYVRNTVDGAAVYDERTGINLAAASPVPVCAETVPKKIKISFITPCRIRENGCDLRVPVLSSIVRNIARKYDTICRFYGDEPSGLDRETLAESAVMAIMEGKELSWTSATRYSKRKAATMKLGGFTGWATYSGLLAAVYPLLKLGEVLQVGKNTSFGYGAIRIEDCSRPRDSIWNLRALLKRSG
ncbi:MAG TPA: CRISPR system precrRNA processing endoribonuclease RAMP protein Cas6 [Spirochaetota bacterium]|nr:CRISPR system precrRNA processing endoribonuclease RAMP protein Cas6 [Spirochaetota bacterium]